MLHATHQELLSRKVSQLHDEMSECFLDKMCKK